MDTGDRYDFYLHSAWISFTIVIFLCIIILFFFNEINVLTEEMGTAQC